MVESKGVAIVEPAEGGLGLCDVLFSDGTSARDLTMGQVRSLAWQGWELSFSPGAADSEKP